MHGNSIAFPQKIMKKENEEKNDSQVATLNTETKEIQRQMTFFTEEQLIVECRICLVDETRRGF